ncbi:MAG: hypothetical protein AAFR17_01830 [Pseudomonadota bacterium]
MHVAIATGRTHPELSPSNACYAGALTRLGAEVTVLAWNRDPVQRFLEADLVVLRQTWDYILDAAGFAAWLAGLTRRGARIANPAAVAIWNNDKRCLIELGAAGFETPATIDLAHIEAEAAAKHIGGNRFVLKPAYGGGGYGVRLAERGTVAAQLADAQKETPGTPFLLQAFLPEIAEGEWTLCFTAGEFSHACLKVPAAGEFRVNGRFGPTIRRATPSAEVLATATAIARHAGDDLLYARVDGVLREGRFVCTELELTDPDLHLETEDDSADRLARATFAYAGERPSAPALQE